MVSLLLSAGNVWAGEPRSYFTSFETVEEFKPFYIVQQNYKNTTSHDLSDQVVHSGDLAHMAWIYGTNPASSRGVNNNHRGYPTIQLYKLPDGAFATPAKIEFWVWLDMEIAKGEWFSFATFDHTTTDRWDAVLVNLSDEGFVHLMHAPKNGQADWTFQTDTITFPQRQWVKLTVLLHFDKADGFAKVYQDDQLVSAAPVRRGDGWFTQAHFGMYAPPSIARGVVFNDDLRITEISEN